MRTHTNNFKNALTGIRQTDNKIIYTKNGVIKTLTADNIFRLSKSTNSDLLKTVMKTFEFESDIKFTTDTTFNLQSGLLVNEDYEYLDYGNYFLKDQPEYDLNSKRYTYTCYDKMLLTMINYTKPQGLTFPITVRDYITTLANACGLEFAKDSSTFVNYNKFIASDPFEEGNYTFRDILDYLSQVVAGWFIINDDDELDIKYPTETNEEFSNDYLLNINVDFNKKYGPVNSLVFSRSSGADNIYRKDQTSIDTYGLCELKFSDNPFLNGTDRDEFIDEIFDELKGLEFYIMDVETTGLMFLDIGDLYSFRVDKDFGALKSGITKAGVEKARAFTSGARKCLMLNDEIDLSSGINEKIYTDEPELTETDYKSASLSDNEIKQAILLVNKATAEIELKVSKNEVISAINLSPEEITINANKIKLEGYTTINGKFSVDLDGNMTATGGTIGGWNIDSRWLQKQTGNYSFEIRTDRNSDQPAILVYHSTEGYKWYVRPDGYMYAANANISGTIYSSSGTIGGWNLFGSGIYGTSTSVAALYTNGNFIMGGTYGMVKFDTNPVRITTANKLLLSDNYGESSMATSGDTISIRAFNGTVHINSNYGVYAGTNRLDNPSSKNVKENIKPLKQELVHEIYEEVKKMPMYTYDYKKQYGDKNHFGFVLEDIENTCLKNILRIEQNKEDKNIKYYSQQSLEKMNTLLIQELMKKIDNQQKEIEMIKEKNR